MRAAGAAALVLGLLASGGCGDDKVTVKDADGNKVTVDKDGDDVTIKNEDGEVTVIDGRPVETILDYIGVTAVVTLIGFPVLTLPVGGDGLPFGIQLIARPGEERRLIRLGRMLEREAGFTHRWAAAWAP